MISRLSLGAANTQTHEESCALHGPSSYKLAGKDQSPQWWSPPLSCQHYPWIPQPWVVSLKPIGSRFSSNLMVTRCFTIIWMLLLQYDLWEMSPQTITAAQKKTLSQSRQRSWKFCDQCIFSNNPPPQPSRTVPVPLQRTRWSHDSTNRLDTSRKSAALGSVLRLNCCHLSQRFG